jgi:hypothetical protein
MGPEDLLLYMRGHEIGTTGTEDVI